MLSQVMNGFTRHKNLKINGKKPCSDSITARNENGEAEVRRCDWQKVRGLIGVIIQEVKALSGLNISGLNIRCLGRLEAEDSRPLWFVRITALGMMQPQKKGTNNNGGITEYWRQKRDVPWAVYDLSFWESRRIDSLYIRLLLILME